MELYQLILLAYTGLVAGTINGAVGSGSLITLPVLLSFGLAPTSAVSTNIIAMVLSAFGGVMAYRTELKSDLLELKPLILISAVGGVIGAILLLTTPVAAIRIVVPILIAFALVLVVSQPLIVKFILSRADAKQQNRQPFRKLSLRAAILGCAIYGGYFNAAQGVLLLATLGASSGLPMRRLVGTKNLLTLAINITAAIMFTITFFLGRVEVVWPATAAIATGALIGGYAGGQIAKRIPPWALRLLIAVIASAALVRELLN